MASRNRQTPRKPSCSHTLQILKPHPSVYVKNLQERIKIDDLKEALTEIFSEYGTVIDLVAKKNLKARGQAFVVFEDVESAERAIKEVQGFELFEKPMLLDYAKTRSDATVQKESDEEEFESYKRRRLAEKGERSPWRVLGLRGGRTRY